MKIYIIIPLIFLCLPALSQIKPQARLEVLKDTIHGYKKKSGFDVLQIPTSGVYTVKGKMPGGNKEVSITGEVINGNLIVEGDIILGPVSKFFGTRPLSTAGNRSFEYFNFWSESIIPYELSNTLEAKDNIEKAIHHINEKTNLTLVPRTDQTDYIKFSDNGHCESPVGKQNGIQEIYIAGKCGFGTAVHEILHSAGFWHEQSRTDRDQFVEIDWDNILPGEEHNFKTYIERDLYGVDIGTYDYGSIMHYQSYAFADDRSKPTIKALDPSIMIGNREALSAGDIAGVNLMYPVKGKNKFISPVSENIATSGEKSIVTEINWSNSIGIGNSEGAIILQVKVPGVKTYSFGSGKTKFTDYQIHSQVYSTSSSTVSKNYIIQYLPSDVPIEIEVLIDVNKWTSLPAASEPCKKSPFSCYYSLEASPTLIKEIVTSGSDNYTIARDVNNSELRYVIDGGWVTIPQVDKMQIKPSLIIYSDLLKNLKVNPFDNRRKKEYKSKIEQQQFKKVPQIKKNQQKTLQKVNRQNLFQNEN